MDGIHPTVLGHGLKQQGNQQPGLAGRQQQQHFALASRQPGQHDEKQNQTDDPNGCVLAKDLSLAKIFGDASRALIKDEVESIQDTIMLFQAGCQTHAVDQIAAEEFFRNQQIGGQSLQPIQADANERTGNQAAQSPSPSCGEGKKLEQKQRDHVHHAENRVDPGGEESQGHRQTGASILTAVGVA